MSKYDVIDKTGSTKHITTTPEEDRTTVIGNMHKNNWVKIGRVVPKVSSRTNTQTDTLIKILRSPIGVGVTKSLQHSKNYRLTTATDDSLCVLEKNVSF